MRSTGMSAGLIGTLKRRLAPPLYATTGLETGLGKRISLQTVAEKKDVSGAVPTKSLAL